MMKPLPSGLALPALVSALPCLAAEPARQADLADPGQFQCVGRNRFSGLASVPVEKHGENVSWDYAAFFTLKTAVTRPPEAREAG